MNSTQPGVALFSWEQITKNNHPLFLFDELIAHLDANLRAYVRGELKILQKKLGTTMVYVTHDQTEALSMADRVAVMHEVILQQYGTPENINNKPVDTWVAGFLGEPPMNFSDCELEQEDDPFKLNILLS